MSFNMCSLQQLFKIRLLQHMLISNRDLTQPPACRNINKRTDHDYNLSKLFHMITRCTQVKKISMKRHDIHFLNKLDVTSDC